MCRCTQGDFTEAQSNVFFVSPILHEIIWGCSSERYRDTDATSISRDEEGDESEMTLMFPFCSSFVDDSEQPSSVAMFHSLAHPLFRIELHIALVYPSLCDLSPFTLIQYSLCHSVSHMRSLRPAYTVESQVKASTRRTTDPFKIFLDRQLSSLDQAIVACMRSKDLDDEFSIDGESAFDLPDLLAEEHPAIAYASAVVEVLSSFGMDDVEAGERYTTSPTRTHLFSKKTNLMRHLGVAIGNLNRAAEDCSELREILRDHSILVLERTNNWFKAEHGPDDWPEDTAKSLHERIRDEIRESWAEPESETDPLLSRTLALSETLTEHFVRVAERLALRKGTSATDSAPTSTLKRGREDSPDWHIDQRLCLTSDGSGSTAGDE